MDKKDVIIQVITTYQDNEGAKQAYNTDAEYMKKNGYGKPVGTKTFGESSILLKKKDTDGITYNLLFLKNNVFAGISAKYKKDMPDNEEHLIGLAQKIEEKIK